MKLSDTLLSNSSVKNKSILTWQTDAFCSELRVRATTTLEIDWSRGVMCADWIQPSSDDKVSCSDALSCSCPAADVSYNFAKEFEVLLYSLKKNNMMNCRSVSSQCIFQFKWFNLLQSFIPTYSVIIDFECHFLLSLLFSATIIL